MSIAPSSSAPQQAVTSASAPQPLPPPSLEATAEATGGNSSSVGTAAAATDSEASASPALLCTGCALIRARLLAVAQLCVQRGVPAGAGVARTIGGFVGAVNS